MKKAGLTRERVLAAALDLVDDEGLEALSMRRLGEKLGVEAMSLYRHVPGKSALLDGVFEGVLSGMRLPDPGGSWQKDLRGLARAFYGALGAHPRAVLLFASRPAVTPGSLAHVEAALEVLGRAGFPPGEALSAFQSLAMFVVGHALQEFGEELPASSRVPYEELPERVFPRLTRLAPLLAEKAPRGDFDYGLDTFLLGLKARQKRLGSGRGKGPC